MLEKLLKHDLGSNNKRVLLALVSLIFFILIGKLAGAGKEMAVAYRFGIGPIVDAYVLVIVLVTWIPAVWASVLNSVFVPLVNQGSLEEGNKFIRELNGYTCLAAGIFSLLFFMLAPFLASRLASENDSVSYDLLLTNIRGLAPLLGLSLLAAQLSVQLLSLERHANTLLGAIPPLVLASVILTVHNLSSSNTLTFGTLAGFGLQILGLYYLVVRSSAETSLSLRLHSTHWHRFRKGIGIMVLAQFIMSIVDPVSSLIASRLGPGNLSGMGYTLAVLSLFLSLGATAIGRAILPVLSDSTTSRGQRRRLALQWASIMFVCGTFGAVVVWIMAPWLVSTLYERGAFTSENSLQVSNAVRFGVFQFPFFFSGVVLAQLFASMGQYVIILGSGIVGLLVKTLASIYFADQMGFAGIVFASAFMYAATCIYFCIFMFREKNTDAKIV